MAHIGFLSAYLKQLNNLFFGHVVECLSHIKVKYGNNKSLWSTPQKKAFLCYTYNLTCCISVSDKTISTFLEISYIFLIQYCSVKGSYLFHLTLIVPCPSSCVTCISILPPLPPPTLLDPLLPLAVTVPSTIMVLSTLKRSIPPPAPELLEAEPLPEP